MSDEISSNRFEHKGLTFYLLVQPDYDAKPTDYDCYDDDDKAAFDRGEWQYVGVQLRLGGWEGDEGFSLWGVEYGENGDRWDIGVSDLTARAKDEGWCDETVASLLPQYEQAVAALRRYREQT